MTVPMLVRSDLAGWLKPILIGPWLAVAGGLTAAILAGFWDPKFGGPFANWLLSICVGTVWALLLSAVFAGVDLLRARRGIRLPAGGRAWLTALLSPLPVLLAWLAFPPRNAESTLVFVLRVVGPNVGVALALRVTCHRGERVR